jgi:hypothetical protein
MNMTSLVAIVASFDSLLWDLIASISYLSQQEVEQGKNPQKREDT